MNLSEKILKLRKVNGLSQDELAEKLNVSRQAVSKWESEQATPELDKILRLAEVFHVTTDYLLQPNATDELALKTTMLEKQQHEILGKQRKALNWKFLIVSIIISLIAMFIVMLIGRYISFPDYGEGYIFLGQFVTVSGFFVVIGTAIALNWRYRTRKMVRDRYEAGNLDK